MRTTVTLDPDTESLVRRRMRERDVSFKQALNDAIREGAAPRSRGVSTTRVRRLGEPAVALDRALHMAAELEDAELIARAQTGR